MLDVKKLIYSLEDTSNIHVTSSKVRSQKEVHNIDMITFGKLFPYANA